jgi:hypothetical protein
VAINPPTVFIAGPPFLSKIEYDRANSSVTGPLQKPDRRDLVGGVVERKKKKLARSEGEQFWGPIEPAKSPYKNSISNQQLFCGPDGVHDFSAEAAFCTRSEHNAVTRID